MMPRTMTPRGTAAQCGRISIGIDSKARLSEKFLELVGNSGTASVGAGIGVGTGTGAST